MSLAFSNFYNSNTTASGTTHTYTDVPNLVGDSGVFFILNQNIGSNPYLTATYGGVALNFIASCVRNSTRLNACFAGTGLPTGYHNLVLTLSPTSTTDQINCTFYSDGEATSANFVERFLTNVTGSFPTSDDIQNDLATNWLVACCGDSSGGSYSSFTTTDGEVFRRSSQQLAVGDSNGPMTTTGTVNFAFNAAGDPRTMAVIIKENTTIRCIDYLIVAGGGGGSYAGSGGGGGGGGAGGHVYNRTRPFAPGVYSVVVGAGGAGSVSSGPASSGSNSSFNGITAIGGGKGESDFAVAGTTGGSGGGTAYQSGAGGGRTSGQGFAGGQGAAVGAPFGGGGGGGAGEIGAPGVNNTLAGDGGDGLSCSITGSAVTRAGGGGGGKRTGGTAGLGGAGGGGNGATTTGGNGSNATANTGSGGGGSSDSGTGGNGADGVVIIRLLTADWISITGGTQTIDGAYTVCTFTSSGTFTLVGANLNFKPRIMSS